MRQLCVVDGQVLVDDGRGPVEVPAAEIIELATQLAGPEGECIVDGVKISPCNTGILLFALEFHPPEDDSTGRCQPLLGMRVRGNGQEHRWWVPLKGVPSQDHQVIDGSWYALTQETHEAACQLFGGAGSAVPAEWSPAQYQWQRAAITEGMNRAVGKRLVPWPMALAQCGPPDPDAEAPPITIKPLPYQVSGIAWLRALQREGWSGMLCDEIGLDMRLQVIAYLALCKRDGHLHALLFASECDVSEWVDAFRRLAPQLSIATHGTAADIGQVEVTCDVVISTTQAERPEGYRGGLGYASKAQEPSVTHVLWDACRGAGEGGGWFGELAYEIGSHSPGSRYATGAIIKTQRIVLRRPKQVVRMQSDKYSRTGEVGVIQPDEGLRHRGFFIGLDLESMKSEIWELGRSGDRWLRRYREEELPCYVSEMDLQFAGVVLRRFIDDVRDELPEVIWFPEPLRMEGRQAVAYEDARAKAQGLGPLQALRSLGQMCRIEDKWHQWQEQQSSPVLDESHGYGVPAWRNHALKIMVCTGASYREAQYVHERVNGIFSRVRVFCLHSSLMATHEIQERLNEFNAHDGGAVLIIDQEACRAPLDIQGVDRLVYLQQEWDPLLEQRATSIACRMGQRRGVCVHRVFYQDTLEAVIDARIALNRGLGANPVAGVTGQDATDLSLALALSPDPVGKRAHDEKDRLCVVDGCMMVNRSGRVVEATAAEIMRIACNLARGGHGIVVNGVWIQTSPSRGWGRPTMKLESELHLVDFGYGRGHARLLVSAIGIEDMPRGREWHRWRGEVEVFHHVPPQDHVIGNWSGPIPWAAIAFNGRRWFALSAESYDAACRLCGGPGSRVPIELGDEVRRVDAFKSLFRLEDALVEEEAAHLLREEKRKADARKRQAELKEVRRKWLAQEPVSVYPKSIKIAGMIYRMNKDLASSEEGEVVYEAHEGYWRCYTFAELRLLRQFHDMGCKQGEYAHKDGTRVYISSGGRMYTLKNGIYCYNFISDISEVPDPDEGLPEGMDLVDWVERACIFYYHFTREEVDELEKKYVGPDSEVDKDGTFFLGVQEVAETGESRGRIRADGDHGISASTWSAYGQDEEEDQPDD